MIVNGTWLIALAAMTIVTAKAVAPNFWSARSGISGVAIPSETASGRYAKNQRSLVDGRIGAGALMSVAFASRSAHREKIGGRGINPWPDRRDGGPVGRGHAPAQGGGGTPTAPSSVRKSSPEIHSTNR